MKALAAYAEVRDLRSGRWDKYLYSLDSWGFVHFWLLFFVGGSIIGNLTSDQFVKVGAMGSAVLAMIMAFRRTAYYS